MTYSFTPARAVSLTKHWNAMKVMRQATEIEKEAKAIIAYKGLYKRAEAATGVPWYMIGVIDAREGGISRLGTRHLHCGDPLTNYTIHVPVHRPAVGHGPPFTWLESAIDALKMKNLQKISNWTVEREFHELEPYNGLGYYAKGIPSPYIWSCTNQYDPPAGPGGKYVADHQFNPHVIDSQVGCAPLIRRIIELDGGTIPTEKTNPSPPPPPDLKKSVPSLMVGGGAAVGAAAAGFPWWGVILVAAAVLVIAALAIWTHEN